MPERTSPPSEAMLSIGPSVRATPVGVMISSRSSPVIVLARLAGSATELRKRRILSLSRQSRLRKSPKKSSSSRTSTAAYSFFSSQRNAIQPLQSSADGMPESRRIHWNFWSIGKNSSGFHSARSPSIFAEPRRAVSSGLPVPAFDSSIGFHIGQLPDAVC